MNQIIVLKALKQAAEDGVVPARNGQGRGIDPHRREVHRVERTACEYVDLWRARHRAGQAQSGTGSSPPHAGKLLLAGDYIGRDNDLGIAWLTGKEDRPKREPKPVEKPKPSPLMTAADYEVPF